MEQKGLRDSNGGATESSGSGTVAVHEGKTSVIDKIKEKLHMH